MKSDEIFLKGAAIFEPELKKDERGYFTRVFCMKTVKKILGISFNIVQINRSYTKKKGSIRGLHFQNYPAQEDKIVQCLKGSIFDVAVDNRKNSKTFGKWFGTVLSEKNMRMLLIPKGFAHGFQALENDSLIEYFVSEYYHPEYEFGIRWNDPYLKINWPLNVTEISDKDKKLPLLDH